MHEAAVTEFPFVEVLPKREKSKLARLWDQFHEVRAAVKAHGAVFPQNYAAALLGVSPQRIHQLVNEGRLVTVQIGARPFVTEQAIIDFAKSERANGVHLVVPSSRQIFRAAHEAAKEHVKLS